MGVDAPDHRILLETVRRLRKKLVGEIEKEDWENQSDLAISGAVLAAIVNVEAIDAVRGHSRTLVWLTWALLAATTVLSVLTAVLVWRTWA